MVGDKRSNEETMNTPYTEAIGKWDTSINTMKQYHPTLICVPATEWEQMNEEIKELRIKSESYDTYLESHGKVWFGKKDKDALLEGLEEPTPEQEEWFNRHYPPCQMQNKHDGSGYWVWEMNVRGPVEIPKEEAAKLIMDNPSPISIFFSKEACERYYRDRSGVAVNDLKAAVDAGKVIVDGEGNEVFKSNGAYTFQEPNPIGSKWGPWWVISEKVYGRAGWRIKPEPEAPNYPLLLAELGMGKMLRSDDGYDLSWSRYTDLLSLYKGGIPTGVYTWNDVVEQVLEKHKGWRVV